MKLVYNTQKSKDKLWKDPKGMEIPYSRTTKSERLMEHRSAKLLKDAIGVHDKLAAFKVEIRTICQEVYDTFMQEHGQDQKDYKGNFTWYNFDRSIKIEVSINDRITFDELGIIACKEKLWEFLDSELESKDEFIKKLVMDAFETSRGKLDVKKVTGLLRYKSKINKPRFQEAMKLLEDSIQRTSSRTYFRIWAKDESGQYQNIDLNLSSINV